LSIQLRIRTSCLHSQIEALLGLPAAIQTLDDYRGWLCRFLGLYAPLEHGLASFGAWSDHGLALPSPSHSACLAADLAVLGIDPAGVLRTPPALLPQLPTFAHAIGALYVLEGSTLGGRVILHDVERRIGTHLTGLTGATQFFGGRASAVGLIWQRFKAALDAFGSARPYLSPDVISGAESAFRAIEAWFVPFCAVTASRP
jgi:heme oxygenase